MAAHNSQDGHDGHDNHDSHNNHDLGHGKTQILLNAFDMFTVNHLAPGQWRNPADQGRNKTDLRYWTELAQLLERGGFLSLFLADTYGGYDTYGDSIDECVRRGVQWPVLDPAVILGAMAAATRRLSFGVTASTSFEQPFLLARRFSTLDHLANGRIGWNIVTTWKKAAFRAIGLDQPIEHDERYARADEFLRVVYKLWEGSWADDAVVLDADADTYSDPAKVRTIRHQGRFFRLDTKHTTHPSPQRTPFLFQAGTSPAGIAFAAAHAEGVFLGGPSPEAVAPKVARIRAAAAAEGRDPRSLKFFVTVTPIIGNTPEEAQAKLATIQKYTSTVGGLVFLSGTLGIDLAALPLDEPLSTASSTETHKILSAVETTLNDPNTIWTPRKLAERIALGGLTPPVVGTPAQVADELEHWIRDGDIDGFNLAHAVTPGTFADVVDLLVPELRRRGIYPPPARDDDPVLTARERVLGPGHRHLPADHTGSRYKYDVYKEEVS